MYTSFYNLDIKPFRIASDPTFIWLGEKHKEALATLTYGVLDNKGFMLLTGDVGTGKTTLINTLIQGLSDDILYAFVPDPRLELTDFLNYIANAFNIRKTFKSKGKFLIYFSEFLAKSSENNKKVLLLIDEAQLLTQDLLEEIRLLSNIQKNGQNLLNIFFVGQDEFNEILERPENRAVAQRMTLNYHLKPLTDQETESYIRHRLSVAGTTRQLFDAEAFMEIHRFSGGFPRRINILCDHCLLTGFVREQRVIGADVVRMCAQELKIPQYTGRRNSPQQSTPAQITRAPVQAVASPLPAAAPAPQSPVAPSPVRPQPIPQPAAGEPAPFRPAAPLRPIPRRRPRSSLRQLGFLALLLAAGLGALYAFDRPTFDKGYSEVSRQLLLLQERLVGGEGPADSAGQPAQKGEQASALPVSGPEPSMAEESAAGENPEQGLNAQDAALPPVSETANPYAVPPQTELPTGSVSGEQPATSAPAVVAVVPGQEGVEPETEKTVVEDMAGGGDAGSEAASQAVPVEQIAEDPATQSAETPPAEPIQQIFPSPPVPPAELPKETILVRFDNDSSDFFFSDIEHIDTFVNAVRQHPDAVLLISGHTDSFGSEGYNYRLSLFRANMIKSFFLGKGIPQHQMRVQAFGSEKPLVSNDTEEGRSTNRRVEIDVLQ